MTNENQKPKRLDIAKEVVRSMVVDAAKHGIVRNPNRPEIKHHCGTRFDFSNARKIVVNDKKRNLRFTMTVGNDSDATTIDYNWTLTFQRNDDRKIRQLLNSDRWKSAVDRISSQLS